MKIAHVISTFPPYYSGTGMVCYHNALGLAKSGHEVTVFTANHPPGDYTYPEGITVRRLPVTFRIGNAPLLPGLLGIKGFDIIHLHHPFIFGTELLWAVTRSRNIPYIITHHNDLIGDGLRPLLFDSYSAVSTRLVFSSASKFAVVSLDHAESCRLAPMFKRRWSDVVEVPNGVDADLFRPGIDPTVVREKHGIPADAPLVLFVGVLDRAHHFKGAGNLIRAFAALKNRDAMLMLVGDGDLKEQFMQQAAGLGIAERTRFVGKVSNSDLPDYYAAADLAVLPSSPPESFGMVLIEAMACGKPVIASNLPGVRAVVSNNVDGLLLQPGNIPELTDKIDQLLRDPERRREMGMRGRQKVEAKYAWSVIIPNLTQVYEEVVRNHAARREAVKTERKAARRSL
jgi:glycosyltransferase involved in cell wall biosynthesis